ncbi:MAG: acetyl-CoA carboxylase biotin carboxyl carrier protein [Stigonema ocellatum SAG 48.90 = DSM 106950]|nr:acetyl-CoA carboxylase biotin carboxyl carrier protein [Stigonema ocellatum SAG 48.90 = DSM 106950]
MPLDFNEIRQLLVTIAQTDIAELTLKSEEFELTVRKALNVSNQMLSGQAGLGTVGGSVTPPTSLPAPLVVSPTASETPPGGVSLLPGTTPPTLEQKLVEVPSPMVGTFYRAPAPGEPSFVEVGDRIRSGQTVCIIEAMKLMNEIEAEVSGQVMEILVQNGEPVEYGQPLMRINPD